MPTLYILRGPDKGRTFEVPEQPATIGREAEQIQLSDESISRSHARLSKNNGYWTIEDLHSSNGTYLNGHRIFAATRLHHGDQIKVGASILIFSGQDWIAHASGERRIRDLVDLDVASQPGDAAILSSIAASDESVILQPRETSDQVAAWNVMYQIAEVIGSVPRIEDFLERVTDILFDHLIVDRLVILKLDPADGELRPQVVRYRTKRPDRRAKINTSRTIISHVIETGAGVLCADAMTDRRFTDDSKQDSIHKLGLRSVLCVPIVAHDQMQGVVHIDCSMSQHTYTQEQLRLATAVGRMIGLAIENARLLETRVRNERLAATGETVARLSHEIRNILQGLRSGADIVEMGLKQNRFERIESGWRIVKHGLERTVVLATNMLSFSKARKPKIEHVQCGKIVADAVELVRHRAQEKGARITLELGDGPAIPVDPHGLQQAVQNVLLNAVDAVKPQKGRIRVRTRYDDDRQEATISISDNGPGVSPGDRRQIFEPLYSSKGHAGTGLGLAVAKKIVAELGGEITLDNPRERGATFRITLPTQRVEISDSEKTHGPAKP